MFRIINKSLWTIDISYEVTFENFQIDMGGKTYEESFQEFRLQQDASEDHEANQQWILQVHRECRESPPPETDSDLPGRNPQTPAHTYIHTCVRACIHAYMYTYVHTYVKHIT